MIFGLTVKQGIMCQLMILCVAAFSVLKWQSYICVFVLPHSQQHNIWAISMSGCVYLYVK